MRIVSIASHGNGAGKTLLIETILRRWPARFAVVKCTTVFRDGQFCPKDARRRCACSKLHDDYNIVTDRETLAQDDTDTGRILAAGAERVLWWLARPETHEQAWREVAGMLPAEGEVLTEGNTALLTVPSNEILFIVNPCMPRRFWKDNWRELAERSAAVIINECPEASGRRGVADEDERATSLAEVQAACPSTPRIVARMPDPFDDWAGPLLESIVSP